MTELNMDREALAGVIFSAMDKVEQEAVANRRGYAQLSDMNGPVADAVLAFLAAPPSPAAADVITTAGVDREALSTAVGGVLVNATNYPEPVQARLLGQDIGPLTAKVVDAVLSALAPQPTPAPVGAAAVERPAHGPDWSDWDFDHPEEWPSCRCGFNGSPEECAAARAGGGGVTVTVTAEVEAARALLLTPRPMRGEFYKHTGGYATELDALRDLYDSDFADALAAALGIEVSV